MSFLDSYIAGKQIADQRRAQIDHRNFRVLDMLRTTQDPMARRSLQQALYSGGYLGEDDEGRLGVSQEDYVQDSEGAQARRQYVQGVNKYAFDAQDGSRQANDEELNQVLSDRANAAQAERSGIKPHRDILNRNALLLRDLAEQPMRKAKKFDQPNFLQSVFGTK